MTNASAAASAELHLKMCKKVARLTKVIFYLNTRNEDYQAETEHVRLTHASELQTLTLDAADKMRTMHSQLQIQVALAGQSAHDQAAERQTLVTKMQQQQRQAHASRVAGEEAFRVKVLELETRVQDAQDTFENRITELTHRAEVMKNEREKMLRQETLAFNARLEEMTITHADERKRLVMTSNATYDKLLADQLRRQDVWNATLVSAQHDRDRQQQETAAEHERQRQSQAVTAQAAFDKMKHEFVTKIEALLVNEEALRSSEMMLRQDKEKLVENHQEAVWTATQLELQLDKTQQDALKVRQEATAHAEDLKRMLCASTDQIDEMAQEVEALKQRLQTRERALVQARKEVETYQLETITYKATASETHARLTQQLRMYELKAVGSNDELQVASEQIKAGQQQIQMLATELTTAHNKIIAMQTEDASSTLKVKAVQTELKQTMIAHEQALEALAQSHEQQLEQSKSRHTQELETHRSQAAKHCEQVEKRLREASLHALDATMAELQRKHEQTVAENEAVATAMQAQLGTEIDTCRVQVSMLQDQVAVGMQQLTALQLQHDETIRRFQSSQQQVAWLQSSHDALQLSALKVQQDRDRAHQHQLQERNHQHESALESTREAMSQVQQQHTNTLHQVAQVHATALQTCTDELQSQRERELTTQATTMRELFEPQVAAFRNQVQVLERKLDAVTEKATENRRALKETGAFEQEALRSAIVQSTEQTVAQRARATLLARQERNKLQLDHSQHVQDVEKRGSQEMQARLASFQTKADSEFARLVSNHRQELGMASQQHAKALQELQTTMKNAKDRAIEAEKAAAAIQAGNLCIQNDRERSRALLEAQTTHDLQYGKLCERMEITTESLTKKTLESASLMREGQLLQAALAAKTEEMTGRVAALKESSCKEIETFKTIAKCEMDKVLKDNLVEAKQSSEQYEETRRIMSDKVAVLKTTVTEWQEKFARRESRPEDVDRIVELEDLVVEMDAVVQRTQHEMAYTKRELLNREEMYNKTFARNPNVGIFHVLKPHVQQQSLNMTYATQPPRPRKKSRESQRRRSERSNFRASSTANSKVLPPLHNNQGS